MYIKDIEKLISQIKKRDEDAILHLIDIYAPLLKTIIRKKLASYKEDVDEVLNDVFLKIWNNIDYFNPREGSFENWICAIANYEAIDRLRKIHLKETLPLNDSIVSNLQTPEDYILENDLFKSILEMLDSLDYPENKVFLDLFFRGLSYKELSDKYGLKLSNLYNIVSRKRKLLKNKYREENNER